MQDKADLVISYSDGGGTMVHVTVTFSITSTAENEREFISYVQSQGFSHSEVEDTKRGLTAYINLGLSDIPGALYDLEEWLWSQEYLRLIVIQHLPIRQ